MMHFSSVSVIGSIFLMPPFSLFQGISPYFGKIVISPYFFKFPPCFRRMYMLFLHALCVFRFPSCSLTMMHLCITQCTYRTPLKTDRQTDRQTPPPPVSNLCSHS